MKLIVLKEGDDFIKNFDYQKTIEAHVILIINNDGTVKFFKNRFGDDTKLFNTGEIINIQSE